MGRAGALCVFAFASACAKEVRLALDTPWPDEHDALVVVTDEGGRRLIDRPWRVAPHSSFGETVDLVPPFRLVAHSYGPEVEIKGDERFGGDGPLLPLAPLWTASVEDADEPVGFIAGDPGNPFDLRRLGDVGVGDCPGVTYERQIFPGKGRFYGLEVVQDRIFVGGGPEPVTDSALLLEIVGSEVRPLARFGAGSMRGLKAVDDELWAVAQTGEFSARSLDGTERFGGRLPVSMLAMKGSADGFLLVIDNEANFFELSRSSTTGIARPDLYVSGTRTYEVVGRDDLWILNRTSIFHAVGSSLDLELNLELELPEFTDCQADGDRVVVTGFTSGAWISESAGAWRSLPAAGGGQVTNLALLPQDRFMVLGRRDAISIWSNERWCRVAPPIQEVLDATWVSPDGRTVIASGYVEPPPGAPVEDGLLVTFHLD